VISRLNEWRQAFGAYAHPQVRSMLFLGFSSGLPLMLVFSSLSFWLREAGIERSLIGFISWVALAYAFKWVWSPLVDRMPLPLLTRLMGRRRAWMLLAQMVVMSGLVGMALSDPREDLMQLVAFAVTVAFASATQDIVIDAYRIESVDPDLQGAMASTYMIGYRLAMILGSAGALGIAAFFDPSESSYEQAPWMASYGIMAGMMLVGVVTTLLISEPKVAENDDTLAREKRVEAVLARFAHWPPTLRHAVSWLYGAVIGPFADFIRRYRWSAVLLLALIATYRISDIVLGVISNVFYVDMGFSKAQVAAITKVFGVAMTLLGAGLGGVLIVRFGVLRILFLGAALAAGTNLLFSVLAGAGNNVPLLTLVISIDNLSAGIATAAFVAYLSSLTNVAYSATQYALFSSIMLLFPKFLGGFSGVMVDRMDYSLFFVVTALMGVPVLLLIALAGRYAPVKEKEVSDA